MEPISKEQRYFKTTNRIGFTLLFFFGLFMLFSGVTTLLAFIGQDMNEVSKILLNGIPYGIMYALVFLGAGWFFYGITAPEDRRPMYLSRHLPRETLLYIFATVGIIYAMSYCNTFLLEPFSYSEFSEEVFAPIKTSSNLELMLAFFSVAVVPGFVEEFLFRGVILTNLLPYGRTTAIIGSALLFGAMHQNPGQFLYTTAAGLILGYVYVKTKSLWCCVAIHFSNNFLSVFSTAIGEKFEGALGVALIYVLEATVFILGVASLLILIFRHRDPMEDLNEKGCFLRDVAMDEDYAEIALPMKTRVRGFFSVPTVIFLIIVVVQMFGLITFSVAF